MEEGSAVEEGGGDGADEEVGVEPEVLQRVESADGGRNLAGESVVGEVDEGELGGEVGG